MKVSLRKTVELIGPSNLEIKRCRHSLNTFILCRVTAIKQNSSCKSNEIWHMEKFDSLGIVLNKNK